MAARPACAHSGPKCLPAGPLLTVRRPNVVAAVRLTLAASGRQVEAGRDTARRGAKHLILPAAGARSGPTAGRFHSGGPTCRYAHGQQGECPADPSHVVHSFQSDRLAGGLARRCNSGVLQQAGRVAGSQRGGNIRYVKASSETAATATVVFFGQATLRRTSPLRKRTMNITAQPRRQGVGIQPCLSAQLLAWKSVAAKAIVPQSPVMPPHENSGRAS